MALELSLFLLINIVRESDREWRWLPADRLSLDLITSLVRQPAKEETFESKRALKTESEISLISSSRSLEFRCFAILVDHRPHRTSQTATLELVMKLTAEGLTLIQLMFPSGGLGPYYRRQLSSPRSTQSRPNYTNITPTHLPDWPRFALIKLVTSPLNLMLLHFVWIGRRRFSYFVSTKVLVWLYIYLNLNLVLSHPQIFLSANISRLLSDDYFSMKESRSAILTSPRLLLSPCSRFGKLDCYKPVIAFSECKEKQSPPPTKGYDFLSSKNIDEHLSLKYLPLVHPVLHSVNQICLFRYIQSAISLLAFTFFVCSLKYLETESIQKLQPEAVIPLSLLQPSRTMTNCSRQTSRTLFRISLLSDFKSLQRPSFPVMKKISVPPSFFMEKNQKSFISCLVSATHEAKTLLSTSQNLMIVTISKVPELFSEVSLTHHDLACGMLVSSLCLRVSMDLSYLIYVVSFCFLLLFYPTMYLENFVSFGLME